MKILLVLTSCIFFTISISAQVGINTTQPTASLDVNGDFRVRNLAHSDSEAKSVIGVDDQGNFIQVEMGSNVKLENNKIVSRNLSLSVETLEPVDFTQVNNMIVWPGGGLDKKSMIRIPSSVGDIDITGIQAGEDGDIIYLYPVDGDITLIPNSTDSDDANRILDSSYLRIREREMVQLFYDGVDNKWVVMRNKHN